MAIGAIQPTGYAGANITFGAAVGVDVFPTGDRRFLWVKNGGGVSTQVAIVIPGTTFEQANPDVVVNIAAGAEAMFGPVNPELGDASGNAAVLISPTASVTVAAVEVSSPPPGLPT